jgi:anti-anti-sigma factor
VDVDVSLSGTADADDARERSGPEPASEAPGEVAVLLEAQHILIMLHGDVDLRVSDDLEQAGRYAIDAARPALMDVRHVTMIDSVGLSFVVRLAAGLRAAGQALTLRGPCPRVAELLTLVGADELVLWTEPVNTGELAVMASAREAHRRSGVQQAGGQS